MADINTNQLKPALKRNHNCSARLVNAAPAALSFGDAMVWEGVAHGFDTNFYPKAKQAHAWTASIEGSIKRRFFAVPHLPPITPFLNAVPVTIVTRRRAKNT